MAPKRHFNDLYSSNVDTCEGSKACNGVVSPANGAFKDKTVQELCTIFPGIDKDKDVMEAILQDRKAARAMKSPKQHFSLLIRTKMRCKSMAMLALLLMTLPISLLFIWASIAWEWVSLVASGKSAEIVRRLRAALAREQRCTLGTAIVSGAKSTKGLHVCRHLHRAGWCVVLVDVDRNWAAGARWSSCVAAFRTTPAPNVDPVGYLKALTTIAAEEGASLFVPVSIAQFSVYEALAAQLMGRIMRCKSCTTDARTTAVLNDKVKFTQLCKRIGLPAPRMFPITSAQQLFDLNSRPHVFGGRKFLLKSIHYAATHRADLFTLPCSEKELAGYVGGLEVSESRPWILQQFLSGAEYSSYSIAHEGQVVLHSDNEACLSCLDYAHVDDPAIWEWVRKFCEATGATGQLCFDFIRDETEGRMLPIECNPRTSTIFLNFYNHPAAAEAFYSVKALLASERVPLKPLSSARPVVWLWNEVGELLLGQLPRCRSPGAAACTVAAKLAVLWSSTDAVLDLADPLPFLGLHYMQVPWLLLKNVWRGNPWIKIDLCTGKLVEIGGD